MHHSWFLRRLRPFLGYLSLLVPALILAAEPADSDIKGALADVTRYEQQFAGQTRVSTPAAKRTLRLLQLTRERLDRSPNKSHPSWEEADGRLKALVAFLEGPEEAGSTAPASPAAPAQAAAAAAAPQMSASAAPMISQLRVRLKRHLRDVQSATEEIDQGGVQPFQDPAYIAEWEARLARFREALAGYAEYTSDPEVVQLREAVQAFAGMLAFGKQQGAEQLAALGDVQARLAAMEADRLTLPEAPAYPYSPDGIRSWITALAQHRQAAIARVEELQNLAQRAHLPLTRGTVQQGAPYDRQDLDRLHARETGLVRDIDEALGIFAQNLDAQVSHVQDTVEFVHQLDPEDTGNQIGTLLGAGAPDELRERLATADMLTRSAIVFDQLLQREEPLAAHQQAATNVAEASKMLDAKIARAREVVRLPDPVSTDRALIAIAEETLTRPDYAVGEIRRMVINADIVQRERETSEIDIDDVDVSLSGDVTLSGTETTWTYRWEQFQVATAEPVDDTFFIFYNTLKNYTSGGPNTPLNKWILAGRMQGAEIPEANIAR